jgi:2-oxoisovalerate dehydrogenase E1 component beta subunit
VTTDFSYVDIVRHTLDRLLSDDMSVVVLGEDIGLGGGAFRATEGLQEKHGADRVRDTPISEAAFTGVAIGLALEGYRPIVEYQFSDFLTSGMTQVANVAAKMHFRARVPVPLTIRAPAGGGFSGGPFHSQNPEAWFLRTPGLKVCVPATAEDAGRLLTAAVHDPNPVIVLEQKYLYTRLKGHFEYESDAVLFGAEVRRGGTDVTVVTYGAALHLALDAAEHLADQGVECEVVDLRVLCPLDWGTIAASVRKTSRCVVVHEDYVEYGVGAEISARVAFSLFTDLDAPVGRVGSGFWPIPFSPPLEQATLPSAERIIDTIQSVVDF